jgi:hypothetical protein
MCESFFATLECELLARCRFKTQAEARSAVFAFIEGFYNPRRRHSSLNYLSSIDYERRHYAMIVVADDDQPAAVLAAVNRDRGASRDATPPTPPGIRVRTTAVRRIKPRRVYPWRATQEP